MLLFGLVGRERVVLFRFEIGGGDQGLRIVSICIL